MVTINKSSKNANTQYVACHHCSMQPVCQPVRLNEKSDSEQSLDLSTNYLTRRIPIEATSEIHEHQSNHNIHCNNAILFEEKSALTSIFAVCSGIFKLCKINGDGSENIIGLRFPGELIGEDSLFLKTYNYSAIAIGNSSVCEVQVDQMASCGQLVPELQQNLITLLNKQSYLHHINCQAYIGKKSAESLLAAFLLNVIDRNAAHSGSDSQINLVISRHDIANFLGLRRETLSRLLTRFQKDHLIFMEGKLITLLAKDNLRKLANIT